MLCKRNHRVKLQDINYGLLSLGASAAKWTQRGTRGKCRASLATRMKCTLLHVSLCPPPLLAKRDILGIMYLKSSASVLSEVGIIPAYLMGVNILKLRTGILKFLKGTEMLFLKDSATKLAYLLNMKKINNLVFLCYSPELEKFLFWCQQLIAESLGKKNKGFLPMISRVPKDHHSLMQLYLDGPKDKLFHIFSCEEKYKEKINITKAMRINNFLNKKNFSTVKNAQRNSLISAFKKKKIPFREFRIKKINEEVLGELFSYFTLETVITGKLANIDPFNQPAVEQVKIKTKKLLS